ncbi:hypothetical protein BAY61_32170 (plasmid) [Prauserella marina]|uniref:Uncharacterized protein n=1 Tax=Prauserella marina TaxID=530584 RepID=A0A222W1D5_9PSEU|nr:helix-turn-helix transcriptional regulator [Prauserella marina]ASR39940.1 hypothetical protein BAY61_32170 [Prauserella marina]PWV71443.1 hypothetical protein DES30_112159 [Prauserella marina]SDD97539.1 hypothetical protein SAMN05421630_115120 [Prauserella marina]
MSGRPSSFAEKFQYVIDRMHPPDRAPYSDLELHKALGVSRQYIYYLRTGKRGQPSGTFLERLTDYFGLPAEFFTDDEVYARVAPQLEQLVEEAEIERIAQRVWTLSPSDRKAVSNLMDTMQDYHQRPRDQRKRRKPR